MFVILIILPYNITFVNRFLEKKTKKCNYFSDLQNNIRGRTNTLVSGLNAYTTPARGSAGFSRTVRYGWLAVGAVIAPLFRRGDLELRMLEGQREQPSAAFRNGAVIPPR